MIISITFLDGLSLLLIGLTLAKIAVFPWYICLAPWIISEIFSFVVMHEYDKAMAKSSEGK